MKNGRPKAIGNGNGSTREIVAKLWNLCHVLRDDGVSYTDYVTELTFLLFLKMLQETGHEQRLPAAYRWRKLAAGEGLDQLDFYRQLLLDLGNVRKSRDPLVLAIFTDAQTKLRKPTNLKALTDSIDKLDWFSAREEGLGNLYEGLLEKNAAEKKSGAGQYFTPRPLIDCIVRLVKPEPGEVVQDPAAGTGGFLVAADRYIKDRTDELYELKEAAAVFQRRSAFVGVELVPDTHRLCLMNLMLHGIESSVDSGDTLSPDGERIGRADVILTNPPFGNKRGGARPTRQDFSATADTSNKQLAFIEHIVRALKPGGRAAVVVPDNVLFEENVGRRLRTWMMELCDVHTLLRLPTGIFYAQGVKTNVLFMTRGKTQKANTAGVWVYDMRTNAEGFGKTRPLCVEDFTAFEKAFGSDRYGRSKREDEGGTGRFRYFSRAEISANAESLDFVWLRDSAASLSGHLETPATIAEALMERLRAALHRIERLTIETGAPGVAIGGADGTSESLSATGEIALISPLIDRYRQSLLVAAVRGALTETWRKSVPEIEPAAALVNRTPTPTQPRGGRVAAERVIRGVAGLSVNDPKTPLPPNWAWVPLNRIARQETGHTPSRSHPEWWGGKVPWVGIKDAAEHHGGTVEVTIQSTNADGLANSAARVLPAGTVCLSRTASIGYVVILGRDMATSQDFVTWTCTPALLPKYLMFALMAEGEEIRRFGKGSTHTTIYFPEVRAMHIALAPLDEQRQIVKRVEEALFQLDGTRVSEDIATPIEALLPPVAVQAPPAPKSRSVRSRRASARHPSGGGVLSSAATHGRRSVAPSRCPRRSRGKR